MRKAWIWIAGLVCLAGLALSVARAGAEAPNAPKDERASSGRPGMLRLLPPDSVTEHVLQTKDGPLAYVATAGTLPLLDTQGEQKAAIFYVAYRLKDADSAARPVTFVFNGGPGAASAYLHLGLVGPKRLDFGPTGRDGANAHLRDNPESWLAFTDLVMIDPIGTGWSRTAKPDDAGGFYGVNPDAQVMAKMIALYLTRNGRIESPKYLLGESYGGYRAAKVAKVLRQEQGIFVSGILMVSPLLEGGLHFGHAERFALACALQLPSIAASEAEWQKTFSESGQAEAERFARTDYLSTLVGAPPDGAAAQGFYVRVAALTGLPFEIVSKSDGCLRDDYLKKRRAAEGEILSIYDATFAAPDPSPNSAYRGPDPVLSGFTRALGGAFSAYARDALGFKTDMTYALLPSEPNSKWDWPGGRSNASVTDELREMITLSPSFRLFVAHGYSDLVIPYAVSRYVVDHLPRPGAPDRAMLKLYRGGHMFYFHEGSRLAMFADARAFYAARQTQ
ncbi:MAG: S10 family peptidase [Pseudorhodoplanes sp.]